MQCFRNHCEKVQDETSGIPKDASLDDNRREAPIPNDDLRSDDDVIEWEIRKSAFGTIL